VTNSTVESAIKIDAANKQLTSLALLIQAYALSVNSQPTVNFKGFKNLEQYQKEINSGLSKAKTHANTYLNIIQPSIQSNIANIESYYALHNSVASTLPQGSTESEWITSLNTLRQQSQIYQRDARKIVSSLEGLVTNLTGDSAAFTTIVSDLNSAVNGDNGILAGYEGQLGRIQDDIDGTIAGIVLSGLAILGGIFMIIVGAVSDFVTAGTTTPLIVGGIGVLITGVGGEITSAIELANLNNEKAGILQDKSKLTKEVNLALGISSAYGNLNTQVGNAVKAAKSMENAWNLLSDDLGNLSTDLSNGMKSTGEVRKLFLTDANTEVGTVTNDIRIIKAQMAGVKVIPAPKGKTVAETILAEAHKIAA
jgi:non-hemolytic enterotoxin B/C